MSRPPRIQLLAWCGVSGLGQPVSVSFGHGDREYTSGFRRGQGPEYLVTQRWGRREASFWLPVRIVGRGRLRLEGSRPGLPETEIQIRQHGLVGRFVAGPRRQSHEFEIDAGSSPSYNLVAASGESDSSILVSKIAIDPERPFSLQPEPAILLRTALGAALLAAALSSSLGAARAALASGALFGLSLSLVAAFDLFAALHLARKVSLIVPFLVAAAGLVWRSRDHALLIVAAGVMLRPPSSCSPWRSRGP